MRTALLSTIAAAALVAAPALAQTIVAYDSLSAKFDDKRAVVDSVQQLYGETIAYEKGETLPDTISDELVPGNTLPEEAPMKRVEPELAEMIEDNLPEGAQWVEVGPHLVAVDGERRIVMVVYDVVG
jgi:hypothetical protein